MKLLLTIVSALLLSAPVFAADRALLIGVGDYQMDGAQLPGIEKDLETMRALSARMGFEQKNIRVLEDRQASRANIRINFNRHLISGVKPEDRVLFYFSGHGTQVPDASGDEDDGADEALMTYDTRLKKHKNGASLEKILLDDELDTLLSRIPAREILVIVDACHSGTVTRNLFGPDNSDGTTSVSKSFIYEGMPEPGELVTKDMNVGQENFNYVGLSAAADDELAIATDRGSVFTQALSEVLSDAEQNGDLLSLDAVADLVAERIIKNVQPERVFTPQLSGDVQKAESYRFRFSTP